MSNLDTRLRETLDRVAETTKVRRRVDEIVQVRRRRRLPPFTAAVAAFAAVAAVFALPIMIGSSPTNDAAGSLRTPADVASTPSTSVDEPITVPEADNTGAIAAQLGGSALTEEKLKMITGLESDMAYSGYLIDSTTTSDGSYELGLIVFEENLPSEGPLTCFTHYAITEGVNVAGGSICGSDPDGVAEIASFNLSIGGSCGGVPKENPVVDGVWTLLTVWGIPETITTVAVQLADGSTTDIIAANGVAHHLWESSVGIESLEFDGMNDEQRNLVSSYLPAPGIDC